MATANTFTPRTSGTLPEGMQVFDRGLLRKRRDRAARGFPAAGFLFDEVAARLADRMLDIKRDFPTALDLGCHTGHVGRALDPSVGVTTLVEADLSPTMASKAGPLALAADEEALPFRSDSFDLVMSNLSLHWVNDLPGALIQINKALKPDGLFVAALLGGDSLIELRQTLLEAEITMRGGAGPRVSPLTDVRDAGGLLQRAGFALPVVDSDRITVTYDTALNLLTDLRSMGEANALLERPEQPLSQDILIKMAHLYHERFGLPDGRVPATFDVIYLHGWAPHASQQQPLRPGSAESRLADALGGEERAAGDKAAPLPGTSDPKTGPVT